MSITKWLNKNIGNLQNKTVVITGATGGLGKELCHMLASRGANLVFACRNQRLADDLKNKIIEKHPTSQISFVSLDLSNMENVKSSVEYLKQLPQIDYFICNAGVYNVPVKKLDSGYNNIFTINFLYPYYMIKKLMDKFRENKTRVIAVSSIAHTYSKMNLQDIDFSIAKKPSKIYGNSKRFLTFGLFELFKNETQTTLSIVHPGITLTNMTNHYPKSINWLVKIGIKLLFPSPKKATFNLIYGTAVPTKYHTWIGPVLFNIWGKPKIKKLKTTSIEESQKIFEIAENLTNF